MTDIKSPEERSINMAAIKGRDTKPEQYIAHELFMRGYRYRKHVNYIEGHPDLFLRKYNTAVFIHGCFWHRHDGCRYAYTPKTRVDFWKKKFADNTKRDQKVQKALLKDNIKCIIIWECTVKKMMKDKVFHDEMLERIEGALNSEKQFNEF